MLQSLPAFDGLHKRFEEVWQGSERFVCVRHVQNPVRRALGVRRASYEFALWAGSVCAAPCVCAAPLPICVVRL